jgi:hypothetical protein
MNKQIYLIGDVHGCYDTLIALIAQLPENAKIIFCGDLKGALGVHPQSLLSDGH